MAKRMTVPRGGRCGIESRKEIIGSDSYPSKDSVSAFAEAASRKLAEACGLTCCLNQRFFK